MEYVIEETVNIIKRIRLQICWRRGHRIYLGVNPHCATCEERKSRRMGAKPC